MVQSANVTALRVEPDGLLKIEYRSISSLIPYAKNARTHSESQVAEIAGSIRRFGFVNPVLVAEDGTIIAGHGRVMAARLVGIQEVPTIVLAGLNEAQRRALALADNRIALNSGWDFDVLRAELFALREADFDVLGLGFSGEELDALFSPVTSAKGSDPDTIPDAAEPRCKLGDVWKLGRHYLVCGDTSDASVIESATRGMAVDVTIYDPPYDVPAAWTWLYPAPRALVFADYKRVREVASCCAGYEHVYEFVWDGVTSWYTPNRPLARHKTAYYASHDGCWNFEAAIYHDGKDRKAKKARNTRGESDYEPLAGGAVHLSTVFQQQNTRTDGGHAHAKPVKWVRALMKGTGGSVFLDQFVGSGTSYIAATDDITVCGVEIDPRTCDVAIARWEEFTGKQAERVSASHAR
mgnify:CR=1 FL=1